VSTERKEPWFEPLNIGEAELRRRMLDRLMADEMRPRASIWLTQRDVEERSRREAAEALSNRMAKKAITIAIVAIIVPTILAAIAICISVIAVVIAHRDSMPPR
jgi:hypothetical protein